MLSGMFNNFSHFRSCNCCIFIYSSHACTVTHLQWKSAFDIINNPLDFCPFRSWDDYMITSTCMIFSYGPYKYLFLFLDRFRIHKCHFSVITFGKFSWHAETVAFLNGKFSIPTIPFNQVSCHRCYSNKSISLLFRTDTDFSKWFCVLR